MLGVENMNGQDGCHGTYVVVGHVGEHGGRSEDISGGHGGDQDTALGDTVEQGWDKHAWLQEEVHAEQDGGEVDREGSGGPTSWRILEL